MNAIPRSVLIVAAALIVLLPKISAASKPPVVIDVHTHVFNAHDVPVGGIMRAQSVPLSILGPVVEFIMACTDDYVPGAGDSLRSFATLDLQQPLTIAEADKAAIRSFVGQSQLRALAPSAGIRSLGDGRQIDEESLALAAAVFEAANIPPQENDGTTVNLRSVSPTNAIAFVGLMRQSQLAIARRLQTDFPGVDLFLHHMMDLQKAYDDTPANLFPEQMRRMDALETEPGLVGHFLHFAAFDPFRADAALDTIREPGATKLRGRALGVKFYPPSGYRPTANAIDPQPPIWKPWQRAQWNSRYDQLGNTDAERNARLDAINDQLFAFCAQNDIPVFVHCTGFGFQAVSGYGMNCDPKYWRVVLTKYPALRLCFAHAGGEPWWFSAGEAPDPNDSAADQQRWTFGREVVQLCIDFKNVYCEAGYLDPVLSPGAKRDRFVARLKEAVVRDTLQLGVKFGNKIMYGTDWHMIYKEKDYTKYLESFATVFSDPVLQPFATRFFAGTAAEYLKLKAVANDPRFTPEQRAAIDALLKKLP